MDILIIEKGTHNLYAYENDKLLFYSIVKYHFFKRNVITIFDGNDEQILVVETFSKFIFSGYRILYQNKRSTHNISKIEESKIYFGQAEILTQKKDNIFSLNINVSYSSTGGDRVGKVKQKMWAYPQKMHLKVENKNIQFLNPIILHVLATRTEQ